MPDDSLAAIGESIRTQFTHQMTTLGMGWFYDPLQATDWEILRALEADYITLLQPVMDWLSLEQWLTSGFIPSNLIGESPTGEESDAPPRWDSVFDSAQDVDSAQFPIPGSQYPDQPISIPSTGKTSSEISGELSGELSPLRAGLQSPIFSGDSNQSTDDPSPTRFSQGASNIPTKTHSSSTASDHLTSESPVHSLLIIDNSQFTISSLPTSDYPPTQSTDTIPSSDSAQSVSNDQLPNPNYQLPIPVSPVSNPSTGETSGETSPLKAGLPSPASSEPGISQFPIHNSQFTIPDPPRLRRPLLNPTPPTAPGLPFTTTFNFFQSTLPQAKIETQKPTPSPLPSAPDEETEWITPVQPHKALRGLQDFARALTDEDVYTFDGWEVDDEMEDSPIRPAQKLERNHRHPLTKGNGKPDHRLNERSTASPAREPQYDGVNSPAQESPNRAAGSPRLESDSRSIQEEFQEPLPALDMDTIYEALVEEVNREYRRFYGA